MSIEYSFDGRKVGSQARRLLRGATTPVPGTAQRTYQSWRNRQIHGTVSAVEDVLATVATNVRRLRHERSLTQDALAELASMDASELRRIESARREPGVRVLARLARGLDVHPGELFDGAGAWRSR